MKAVAVAVVLAIAAGGAAAQTGVKSMDRMDHHGSMSKAADSQRAHKAVGVVKKVDAKAGAATIAHEPVPSLKWPAMTMTFKARDKALLDKLAVDRKVEFEFEQQGKDYVITAAR